jgi:hypothetical protein
MNQIRHRSATALTLLGLVSALAVTESARAEGTEPEQIGIFDDWAAYNYKAADTKVCYVSSSPKGTEPKSVKRDPAFFLVTHMPGRKIRGEVSTIIGYPFAENVKVTVEIDGAGSFTMFTDKDSAWIENPTQETALIAAMQKGSKMTVVGKSRRGTVTTDSYSLSGISAALDAMAKECP